MISNEQIAHDLTIMLLGLSKKGRSEDGIANEIFEIKNDQNSRLVGEYLALYKALYNQLTE
ncbi:hypothetical protein [Companilactobacillus sp.]|uniref:hypothetical protein n=1 Tax=Companilactobacillus sp. TaxID=2767905 RepID=UPI002607634F|nr:hypothetical protein [Companilactobacillus sp.]